MFVADFTWPFRYVKIRDSSSKGRWETGKEKSGDGGEEGPFC